MNRDIHNFAGKLERFVKKIKEGKLADEEKFKLLLKFYENCKAEGSKDSHILKMLTGWQEFLKS